MKNISLLVSLSVCLMMVSCGEKPGGLIKTEEIAPAFTKRLNKAYDSGSFQKLLPTFDSKAKVLYNSEFHPEIYVGREEIRGFFAKTPPGTVFKIGEVSTRGMMTSTNYSYITLKGDEGNGEWIFRMNNMGKIAELTIVPLDLDE